MSHGRSHSGWTGLVEGLKKMLSNTTENQDTINKRVYHTDGVQKQYDSLGLHPTEALALLRVIAEFPHDAILDLGVGAGRTSRYLSQIAKRYECLDYSPVMINHLRRHQPTLSARQGDMRDLSEFGDGTFDLVLASCNLLDAVSHEDRLRVMSEVRRVLRPGGAFIFSSHNRNYFTALSGPRLRLSRNPVNLARNVVRFARQTVNHARIGRFRKTEGEYALLNDTGHDYSLLHYYIDRQTQRAQLESAGFELAYAMSEGLHTLGDGDNDSGEREHPLHRAPPLKSATIGGMPREILLSAIIPVYKGEAFLADAIESTLAQTLQGVEAVVVDDGSPDGSGAIADRYAAAHPDRVRVVHQANQGLPLARNSAIAVARGRYLGLLDADDIWLPYHAERAVAVLEAQPAVGLVHANAQCIEVDGRDIPMPGIPRWTRSELDPFESILLRHDHVSCPTAVFRASVVAQVGAFDARFNRLGCEDRDMWLRIAEVSKLHYLDEVHAKYRVHGGNMSANLDKMLKARRLLVEKLADRPRGKALRRRALAGIEAEHGHDLAIEKEALPSLKAFSRALAYDPLRVDAWKGLLRRIFVGRRTVNSAPRPPG